MSSSPSLCMMCILGSVIGLRQESIWTSWLKPCRATGEFTYNNLLISWEFTEILYGDTWSGTISNNSTLTWVIMISTPIFKPSKIKNPRQDYRIPSEAWYAEEKSRVISSLECIGELGRVMRKRKVIKRRRFSVKRPHALWHFYGYHKMIRWGIVIHGFIDIFSQAVRNFCCLTASFL